jgi:hypothetical protein
LSLQRKFTEADTTQTKAADIGSRTPADFAAVTDTHFVFPPTLTSYNGFLRHASSGLIITERHTEQFQQTAAFFIISGSGDDGDLHATHFVNLIEFDLRENQLFP